MSILERILKFKKTSLSIYHTININEITFTTDDYTDLLFAKK